MGGSIGCPLGKEFTTLVEVIGPGGQGFQGQVTYIAPHFRYSVLEETVGQVVEFVAHADSAIQGQFDQFQGLHHHLEHLVVLDHLLEQDSVETLVVIGRITLFYVFFVE